MSLLCLSGGFENTVAPKNRKKTSKARKTKPPRKTEKEGRMSKPNSQVNTANTVKSYPLPILCRPCRVHLSWLGKMSENYIDTTKRPFRAALGGLVPTWPVAMVQLYTVYMKGGNSRTPARMWEGKCEAERKEDPT